MKNKELIRRIRALTVAGLVATSALASNVTTMTVYAIDVAEGDTVEENNEPLERNRGIIITNNAAVDHNYGTITTNNAIVIDNRGEGTIDTNDGTVDNNNGTITTNNAAVNQNLSTGTIDTNSGNVDDNKGTITTNTDGGTVEHNEGTIGTNNGTATYNVGTVNTNNNAVGVNRFEGTIDTNNGTVDENDGRISDNEDTVTTNKGTVTTNNDTVSVNQGTVTTNKGYVDDNYGEVTTNNYQVGVNHDDGTIIINNGAVGESSGTITTNDGAVGCNSNKGTINANNGLVDSNTGLIVTNNGTVDINDGDISVNYGTVDSNNGSIKKNFGTVSGGFSRLIEETYVGYDGGGGAPYAETIYYEILNSISGTSITGGITANECNNKYYAKENENITFYIKATDPNTRLKNVVCMSTSGACYTPDVVDDGTYIIHGIFSNPVEITGTIVGMCDVSFDVNGHGIAPAGERVWAGDMVSAPTAPTAKGYVFGGWYKEAECTNRWDFDTDIVEEGMTLYAMWTRHTGVSEWTKSEDKHWHSCSTEGCDEILDEADHTWNAGVVSKEPTVEAEGLKIYTCTVCGYTKAEPMAKLNPTPTLEPTPQSFGDVKTTDYYSDAVDWAVTKNITSGVGNGKFAPNDNCTRAQVVTFLWRAYGCPDPTSMISPFSDVQDTKAYYYKPILWAVEKGITSGTGNGQFSPNATVTRGQFVTFLWRAEGKPSYTSGNPFNDIDTSGFYYDAVLWAVEKKVTSGTSSITFSPSAPCTRGQVVTFLYRDLK